MSFTKLSFVQGLQRSLISSGTIPVYSSPLQAKIAAELAADNIKKDPDQKEPSESEVVDTLTDLVEAQNKVIERLESLLDGLDNRL